MPRISRIIAGLLFFWILFLLGIFFWQEKLIFLPSKTIWLELKNPPAEEIFFETPDGTLLNGYFIKHQAKEIAFGQSQKTILFFHGNGGNITSNLLWVSMAKSLGYNIFIFDYRGYGKSQGIIKSEKDIYEDGQSAYDYLLKIKQIKPQNLILWGHSLGSAVALEIAQKNEAHALVLASPFLSLRTQMAPMLSFLTPQWVQRYQFSNEEKIQNIKIPLLVIHGKKDMLIDFSQGRALFDLALNKKELLETEGGHNNPLEDNDSKYLRWIEKEISK